MMIMMTDQEFDLVKLEEQILDNSLSLFAYEDINCRYPERYEVRRSSVLRKRMTNHASIPFHPYHLFLFCCDKMGFIDIGVIHPNDLVTKLSEHGYTIRITKVEIREER